MVQLTGLTRNGVDKYYTKDHIVTECMELINKNVLITTDDLIVEPSAGNGAFIPDIKKLSSNYKFYDLEPQHPEIITQDYLNVNINDHKVIHIIGNPPFGRQSSTVIKFIKKSCSFMGTNSISFILPRSFKKQSLQRHFPLDYHLIVSHDLPDNSFLVNGKDHSVPCVFQIWKKMETMRKKQIPEVPINFKFVKKSENPDISFRRVGANAGTISSEIKNKNEQSHYFIKLFNKVIFQEMISFEHSNTVGPKSISKQEIIKCFNNIQK
jgi:hypothetical protein